MTTFICTYNEFRKAAAEFFRDTQDRAAVSLESAENGEKALGLMYLGMTDFDDLDEHQINDCVMIMQMATKRMAEVAVESEVYQ